MAVACNFSFAFKGSAADLINKAKTDLKDHGGNVTGDDTSGVFSVPVPLSKGIGGHYAINGNTITIEIITKPFVISCNAIEGYINDYLS